MRAGTSLRCSTWSPPAGIGASRPHSTKVRNNSAMPQQPDPRDPVLSDSVVLDFARRHVPAVRAVTGVDESGGEARTYVIDDNIILKTQRPHRVRPRTSLEKEVFHLRA